MGECGASISQTLCIPPDGSRGDHLCVLCSTTYVCVRVCTCMVGARATIVSQALCIFFYPRDQRVSKTPSPNYFPREKNKDREKISRQDIINERTLEREREKKKKSKTSYHHNRRNFRSRNFLTLLASSLLRTHLDPPLRCESQTRPHSIKESHRKIRPPPAPPRSTPLKKNSHASVEPVEKASAKCPASRSPVVFAFIFRERSVFARLATARRCACVLHLRGRCVGAENRPRERIQM